jgi:hypothetical protein
VREEFGLIERKARLQRRRHMTTVFDISMSLDGYVTAAGVRPEEPPRRQRTEDAVTRLAYSTPGQP